MKYEPLLTAILVSACAQASYTPPIETGRNVGSVVIDRPYDDTWSDLIEYASSAFFAIDNYEKESGLMTLSFGSGDASEYIDCGTIKVFLIGEEFSGPYATYLQQNFDAHLSGRMNITARPSGPHQTTVQVNARYVFDVPYRERGMFVFPSMTFSFDSGGEDTLVVPEIQHHVGTPPTRTCRPTGLAEKSVLDGIAN